MPDGGGHLVDSTPRRRDCAMDNSDNVIPLFKAGNDSAELRYMVETWQALYLKRGQSLADPKTAASLHVALEMVEFALNGVCKHGVVTEDQRDQLLGIVDVGRTAADEWQK